MGKTEPTENSENWTYRKFMCPVFPVSMEYQCHIIMKKLKNGCHFFNIDHMEKFQITNPPKFGSPVFWVSMEMKYQHWPLWKNWKIAAISLISITQKIFKLLTPPKFGSLVFWVLIEMEYQCQPLWKNWKMAAISLISIIQKNFKLPTPQSLGLQFSECQWKWNISIGHYEKIEKWLPFL